MQGSRRRRRSRTETENDLLDAALRLFSRDGALAGITLREVAKEAGVNHGQIYQYFGDRRTLLRAAIMRMLLQDRPDPETHWEQDFADRRRAMWGKATDNPELARLQALLALDGDTQLSLFPALELTREALKRDRQSGVLPADADGEVMHALSAATYLGYCIFRETMARDLDVSEAELDERASAVYDRMIAGLTAPQETED